MRSPSSSLATEKSSSFTKSGEPAMFSRNTLSGLMSRWMIPIECASASDAQHWIRILTTRCGASGALRQRVAERQAVEELHRHEQPAVGGLAEVEHADGVRVLEPRARLRLVVEALDPLRIRRHLRVEHLDCDDAIDRDLARLVDDAHAALADTSLDLVPAVDDLADEGILLVHGGLSFTRSLALI